MSLAVLCLAAFAIAAYGISALVGLALVALERTLLDMTPAARARLYLFATFLPLVFASAVLTAALAPSFGWIADHCAPLADPHTHPHICADHHVAVWPARSLSILAFIVAARSLLAVASRARALLLARSTARTLDRASHFDRELGARVLPVDVGQAFVLGVVRPTLYLSRALVDGEERAHLSAVLAHERAHIARRDPLRRFLAGVALSLHLPGIANRLGGALARAQEMAADEVAAGTIGSRATVAEALVTLARVHRSAPRTALAFAQPEVEARVLQLMDERPRHDRPTLAMLLVAAAATLTLVASAADPIHHGVELVLGALGI